MITYRIFATLLMLAISPFQPLQAKESVKYKIIAGSAYELENTLNQLAAEGWRLKTSTTAKVCQQPDDIKNYKECMVLFLERKN